MGHTAIISFIGENKPKLISEITNYLTQLDGEFSGVTFATLGRVCELTMAYDKSDKIEINEIKKGLDELPSAGSGNFTVTSIPLATDSGPTSKIYAQKELFYLETTKKVFSIK